MFHADGPAPSRLLSAVERRARAARRLLEGPADEQATAEYVQALQAEHDALQSALGFVEGESDETAAGDGAWAPSERQPA